MRERGEESQTKEVPKYDLSSFAKPFFFPIQKHMEIISSERPTSLAPTFSPLVRGEEREGRQSKKKKREREQECKLITRYIQNDVLCSSNWAEIMKGMCSRKREREKKGVWGRIRNDEL